jgi:tetratricopeptide (TPR) repeat protein
MPGQQSSLKVPIGAGCRDQRWRVPAVCLVLAAITFAVFGQTLTHEFVNFDDGDYVYDNPVVTQGLTFNGIVWAFTRLRYNNWHPLTWLTHMLDCQLYGLHPGGHHLTNVLLHTATVIALFLVLRQMTGAFWRSAFVAAVFAIHPLRVESVAWVAERKDVLSGLFFMLTIGAYVRYARRPGSWGRYVLLFAMGLMCKPMLVTLPVVLLLLDYWPLRRVEPRKLSGLVLEKLPLLMLSAASCVATLVAQTGAIQSTELYSMPLRLGNALATCLVYLGQMVHPARLVVFYPYPHNGLPAWEVALAGTLLAGLSAVAWVQRRKQPWIVVGWLWYLVMLLPVLGIIQVGEQAHADRYTYLPQIGIYVALTWLVAEWRVRWLHHGPSLVALGGLMAGVVAVLMVCAWKQTAYWQNSETLWTRALACIRGNCRAELNLGDALLQKGRVDEAITHFQEALRIDPNSALPHLNLGLGLFQKGKVDEAITQYQAALEINAEDADAHYGLANALRQKGRVDEAIAHFQKALQIRPDYAKAQNNLGNALLKMARVDEAIPHYQDALQIDPGNAEAHNNLGAALRQKGRLDEAITHFQEALKINPGYEKAHDNLGMALLQKGKVDEAISHFQKALQLKPADPGIQDKLAWLLAAGPEASLRDGNKAVELATQANALTGGENPVILHTLAAAFAEAGRFPEALETAQHALRLAGAQSDTRLAGQLQLEIKLYQAGSPYHVPAQTH